MSRARSALHRRTISFTPPTALESSQSTRTRYSSLTTHGISSASRRVFARCASKGWLNDATVIQFLLMISVVLVLEQVLPLVDGLPHVFLAETFVVVAREFLRRISRER